MSQTTGGSSLARIQELVDRIEQALPSADAKLNAYLSALKAEITNPGQVWGRSRSTARAV